MPAYDYQCEVCGHRFEATHGINEQGPKTCPECKKRRVRRVFAAPALHMHYSPMHPRAKRGRGRR